MKSFWVELLYVGMFFGDTSNVKLPTDKCEDVNTLAAYLATENKYAVAIKGYLRCNNYKVEMRHADSSEAECGIWWFDISWEQ